MKKLVKWFVGPWALLCAVYVTVISWQALRVGETPSIASFYLGKATTYGPKVAPIVDGAGQLTNEAVTAGSEGARGFTSSGLSSSAQLIVIALLVLLVVVLLSGRGKGSKSGGKGHK